MLFLRHGRPISQTFILDYALPFRPVEEAFDVGYICFIWEGEPGKPRTEGVYRIRWLGGPKVPISGSYPWHNPSEAQSAANKTRLLE